MLHLPVSPRGTIRTFSNNYDGVFAESAAKNRHLRSQKSSIIDVSLNSKYASEVNNLLDIEIF